MKEGKVSAKKQFSQKMRNRDDDFDKNNFGSFRGVDENGKIIYNSIKCESIVCLKIAYIWLDRRFYGRAKQSEKKQGI